MACTALVNGRVVLPDRVLERAGVLIEGSRLAEVGQFALPEGAKVIDLQGALVLAGFIDAHLHGGGGSDFMDGSPAAFETIARTHCLHGVTALAATTLSCPYPEMKTFFELYRTAAPQSSTAEFLGVHLEGPYLSQAAKGAQASSGIRPPSRQEVDQLMRDAGDLLLRCSCAPELEGVDYLARSMREAGVLLAVGHSFATYPQMELAWQMGFRHINHMYCATSTVHKVGQRVYGGVVEAAYLMDGLTIELIGDGRHIPPEVIRLALKCKGEDTVLLVSDAMRAAGTQARESYLGACRPENRVIIEDGVAKLPDRSFFAGSIATGDQIFRNAVNTAGLPLPVATKWMSLNPARHLGVQARKGSLAPGKDADVLVFDGALALTHVFARGRRVL